MRLKFRTVGTKLQTWKETREAKKKKFRESMRVIKLIDRLDLNGTKFEEVTRQMGTTDQLDVYNITVRPLVEASEQSRWLSTAPRIRRLLYGSKISTVLLLLEQERREQLIKILCEKAGTTEEKLIEKEKYEKKCKNIRELTFYGFMQIPISLYGIFDSTSVLVKIVGVAFLALGIGAIILARKKEKELKNENPTHNVNEFMQ